MHVNERCLRMRDLWIKNEEKKMTFHRRFSCVLDHILVRHSLHDSMCDTYHLKCYNQGPCATATIWETFSV